MAKDYRLSARQVRWFNEKGPSGQTGPSTAELEYYRRCGLRDSLEEASAEDLLAAIQEDQRRRRKPAAAPARTCLGCGWPMPNYRSDALTCSKACQKRAGRKAR